MFIGGLVVSLCDVAAGCCGVVGEECGAECKMESAGDDGIDETGW